jgi:hypothetical protein
MKIADMHNLVAATLPALGLPVDAATQDGVTIHFTRLSIMAELVMTMPLADDIETPSTFKP